MGALTCKLYDAATSEFLVDISEISLERNIKRLLAGPRTFTIQSFVDSRFTTKWTDGDGFPNLWAGNRKLVVWEDGITDPIFHGRVSGVKRVAGKGKKVPVTLTAFSPDMTELGYEADERAGRVVRDETGNFIDPTFNGGGAISGPDLMFQVLTNSEVTGDENPGPGGEGPHPIDLTGDFDIDVPPAVDLSCVDNMNWPVMVGDFFQDLVKTGVCDYDMKPLAPGGGTTDYKMVELTAKSRLGSDLSATVRFARGTDPNNADVVAHEQDFSKICNKLYDYLGPREDQSHWKGNITPGSPGTTVDPTDSRAFYGGQFIWIREFDSVGTESSSRPLYIALWNAEQGMRIFPRDLLYVTPAPGAGAIHNALSDYDVGDDIGIDTGADFGIELTDSQRVYAFTKTWSRQGVARVSEILTSADVTYG